MRDSPSFACPKEGKRRKRHPGTAPATQVHSDARGEGMRQKLTSLWRRSNTLPHRRSAPDTLRRCASPSPCNAPNTGVWPTTRADSTAELQFSARLRSCRTRRALNPTTKGTTLSERQRACLYWGPWAQRRAAEAEREKDSRMSESRVARRVFGCPLSAGAAQGTDAQHRRKTGCLLFWLLLFGQANTSRSHIRAKHQVDKAPVVDSRLVGSAPRVFWHSRV